MEGNSVATPREPRPLPTLVAMAAITCCGTVCAVVATDRLSRAVPPGSRYSGNGALFPLLVIILATLVAAWALLALRLCRARHAAGTALLLGCATLLLAAPYDLLFALGWPDRALFAVPVLTAGAGLGIAGSVARPTPPVALAGLVGLLAQWLILLGGGTGMGNATLAPLALPPALLAPLVTLALARSPGRWRVAGWLLVGGLLAAPVGLIVGYAVGVRFLPFLAR
ncbi:MAG TPA: hypothetical protein VIL85_22035 [Thermomicrobiales bacterium]